MFRPASRSVFKDVSKLSFDYVPEKLLHREEQMRRLRTLFAPVLESNVSQNVFLVGSVGTGKTHLSKRFCIDFCAMARDKGKNVEYAFANCRQRMSDEAVLLSILKKYDERFPERGFSIAEKLQSLRRHLEKRRARLIVVLDEADVLIKRSGSDLLYSFTRFDEEAMAPKGSISLMLISQKYVLDYLDKATQSTFRRTNTVEFGKYMRDELRDILRARADLGFYPGTVQEQSLDLMADIASEYGDARYAIELLERSGMLADEENVEEVSPEHVRRARYTTHALIDSEKIAQLDRPKKLVLLAVARKAKDRTYITTGEAEKSYALVCEQYDEKKRGHTQFWKYLQYLDALGLIDAKRSQDGLTGRTTIISLPETPAKALAKYLEESLSS